MARGKVQINGIGEISWVRIWVVLMSIETPSADKAIQMRNFEVKIDCTLNVVTS